MAGKAANDGGIEERETFISSRQSSPKKETFAQFLCNKEKGTCLGRTAKSWFQITVFYVIFYLCLAGFWAACLAVFVATLDDKTPRYYGKGTIIGINPGMGYQPWLKEKGDSTLVRFNTKDPKSYKKYVAALDSYMDRYKNKNNTRQCSGAQSNQEDVEESCAFDVGKFRRGCAPGDYGFRKGEPCIVLSLNRLIGWRPVAFPEGSEPEEIKGHYKPGNVGIHCDGEYGPDAENVGELDYIPQDGIEGKFFPFKVMENYHQPIAMVKFKNPPRNRLVQIECKAYAFNIIHDSTDRLGLVHFELLVEDFPPEKDEEEEEERRR